MLNKIGRVVYRMVVLMFVFIILAITYGEDITCKQSYIMVILYFIAGIATFISEIEEN